MTEPRTKKKLETLVSALFALALLTGGLAVAYDNKLVEAVLVFITIVSTFAMTVLVGVYGKMKEQGYYDEE